MLARAKRDYYAVLGVPRDAGRDAIKKAYRALASEYHPDISDDPRAGERFREIAEAYEVLSRPESRARYDRLGPRRDTTGLGRRSADGLFDDLFGGAPPGSPPRPGQRGVDATITLQGAHTDAARGARRGVRYTAEAVCDACAGAGTAPGGVRCTCRACQGSGHVRKAGPGTSGPILRFQPCPACRGAGRIVTIPCPDCEGAGRFAEERALLLSVPPGSREGDVVTVAGAGHAGGPGGDPGDLRVELRVTGTPAGRHRTLRRLARSGRRR
ncbi:MAG: DnaJ domain-containing protein [Thermoleophilia bacterium]|nr:DnaJ domain-containing protein [Thermoleophilia bacterium]